MSNNRGILWEAFVWASWNLICEQQQPVVTAGAGRAFSYPLKWGVSWKFSPCFHWDLSWWRVAPSHAAKQRCSKYNLDLNTTLNITSWTHCGHYLQFRKELTLFSLFWLGRNLKTWQPLEPLDAEIPGRDGSFSTGEDFLPMEKGDLRCKCSHRPSCLHPASGTAASPSPSLRLFLSKSDSSHLTPAWSPPSCAHTSPSTSLLALLFSISINTWSLSALCQELSAIHPRTLGATKMSHPQPPFPLRFLINAYSRQYKYWTLVVTISTLSECSFLHGC